MDHDEELVSACQSGDVVAFETLVRKYQDRIVRLMYLLLGNADDAEDVAQETFIRAFRCIGAFRHRSNFSTWLHRIAVNTARNWIRDNRVERETVPLPDERWWAGSTRPEEILIARERAMEVRNALAQIPPCYREAVILRHFDGLSYEEIAEAQQVPVGTVRSRLAKGRELLQKFLRRGTETACPERMANHGLQEGKEAYSPRSRRGRR